MRERHGHRSFSDVFCVQPEPGEAVLDPRAAEVPPSGKTLIQGSSVVVSTACDKRTIVAPVPQGCKPAHDGWGSEQPTGNSVVRRVNQLMTGVRFLGRRHVDPRADAPRR
jgi:hypothetical protein